MSVVDSIKSTIGNIHDGTIFSHVEGDMTKFGTDSAVTFGGCTEINHSSGTLPSCSTF